MGDASGKARRPAPPCPSLATATLRWRGPLRRPPRPLRHSRSPRRGPPRASGAPRGLGEAREAGATPEGAAREGHVYTTKFPASAPARASLPPLGGPASAYLHAGQARLHRGMGHGGQHGHFLGRDGRAAATRAGDEAQGPNTALGRRGGGPNPSPASAGPAGARGHPSPHRSRAGWWLSGEWRAASPCTAPGGAARGAGPLCELLLLPPLQMPPPSPPLQLGWTLRPGVGMGAHSRPSPRASRSPRPGPAPASAPAAGPGTPPRVSGRGRRLAGAGRPRPQPPAPPPVGAGGDQTVVRGWPPPSVGWAEWGGREVASRRGKEGTM